MVVDTLIALDAMGGDFGPSVVVPAAVQALAADASLSLVLVGDEQVLISALAAMKLTPSSRLQIQHASEVVTMDESPATALRSKKDSSMRVAVNLVKQGQAHAAVSAGNTGALMAISRFVLKTLPGVDRPAIIAAVPTRIPGKCIRMLDLGANVDSTAEHLQQFALMGSLVCQALDKIAKPRVAVLNIGHEDIKGNEQVKQTSKYLETQTDINYVGFIEADTMLLGDVDVVVCDGFVGNVALKALEGSARMLLHALKAGFMRTWWTKLSALLVKPVVNRVRHDLDPGRYNGACFIGLQGIVVKSHGGADIAAFIRAIEAARLLVSQDLTSQISQHQKMQNAAVTNPIDES